MEQWFRDNPSSESDMAAPESALEALIDVERHARLLASAASVSDVIRATSAYLGSWTKERIRSLQNIDGGWGPFNFQGLPEPIHGVADIARISVTLSRHCAALKSGGIEPTPEILELDLFFALSKQAAEAYLSAGVHPRNSAARGVEYRRWSDGHATVA
jgi:hypothetical protein